MGEPLTRHDLRPDNRSMHTVDRLQRQCADAWPAVVERPLGQWRLRAAGGFTGRANSALTVGDPGIAVGDALAEVRAFAHANGIPAAAHVVRGAPVEAELARAGWTVEVDHPGGAESAVMTGDVAGLAGHPPAGVTVENDAPDDWWPLAVGADRPTPAQRRVLAGADDVGFGTARDAGGSVVGVVRAAVVGDLLHIARLAVAGTHRRCGLATGLLAALAEWGTARGATTCALQVAEHNAGAISLYAGLGCRPHHHYRYWRPTV